MDRLDCDRMFVAVLESGGFSRAAARLGTSSGQASKLVSKLEADLGVQLLNRTTRALSPTELGQAYFEQIKRLLEEFDALDDSVRHASGKASGRLGLTVPMSFGTAQLAPVLIDFARAYPDIQLDVSFSDRVVNLVDEGFDVAVRVGNPSDTSLIARKLCPMRVVTAASPAYLGEKGEPLAPAQLADHDCIIDTNFREPLVWRFHAAGDAEPAIFAEFRAVIARREGPRFKLASLERFAFYERARRCFAIVATGERRLYGNVILKKGVIPPN